ncbi:MAG: hypothetical protein AAGE52_33760 [Myxococcota bacterium]
MTDPLDPLKLLQHGRDAIARLDFARAVEILFKVEASPERDILLAHAYRNTARPRDAIRLLDPLVETHVDAASHRGILALLTESHELAKRYFEKAMALGGTVDATHGLAFIEEARTRGTSERSEVYRLLEAGLARYPDHHILVQTLGIALLNDGRLREAREHFEKVIAFRAKAPWAGTRFEVEAHGNLACALVKNGEIDAALKAVEKAMSVCPRWLRQGMAMAMEHDPDLAPLHDHPHFLASMRFRGGASYEERIAEVNAALAAEDEAPAPLPEAATLAAAIQSEDPDRMNSACHTIFELVAARDEIWADHGWCDPAVRARAEEVIAQTLQTTEWLEHHVIATSSPEGMKLAALLLGSYDPKLQPRGARLALSLLEHFVLGDGSAAAVHPLVARLASSDDYGDTIALPEARPALLAVAAETTVPDPVRRDAIEAIVHQEDATDAKALAALVHDPAIATAVIPAVHSLDKTQLDPVPLLDSPVTRQRVARSYAETLAPEHTSTLLDIAKDAGLSEYGAVLRDLLPYVDERFVDLVLEHCQTPHFTHWGLGWMRGQQLSDAQLAKLLSLTFEPKRAVLWVAGVVRGQARIFTGIEASTVAMLPAVDRAPTEGAAQLVGYLGLKERAPWLRDHLGGADKRTTAGIVAALAIVGDDQDLSVLKRLGDEVSWLKSDAWLGRMLLGEDLALLDETVVKTPHGAWVLERLLEKHGPQAPFRRAVDQARERGLHGENLVEFQRVIARVRSALG